MNYSELLQLAKGWGNFKFYRVIIWRLPLSNKKFVAKMQQYPESQYVTVQKFVEENKENAIWGEKEIRKRTEQLGKILYDNIIEG